VLCDPIVAYHFFLFSHYIGFCSILNDTLLSKGISKSKLHELQIVDELLSMKIHLKSLTSFYRIFLLSSYISKVTVVQFYHLKNEVSPLDISIRLIPRRIPALSQGAPND
jgi:hypothetical protein